MHRQQEKTRDGAPADKRLWEYCQCVNNVSVTICCILQGFLYVIIEIPCLLQYKFISNFVMHTSKGIFIAHIIFSCKFPINSFNPFHKLELPLRSPWDIKVIPSPTECRRTYFVFRLQQILTDILYTQQWLYLCLCTDIDMKTLVTHTESY